MNRSSVKCTALTPMYCELRRRWTTLSSSSSSDSDYKEEKCPDTATEQKYLPDISTFISSLALAIPRISPTIMIY